MTFFFPRDYYFSAENLVGDNYLRSQMNDEGYVDLMTIANFPRMQGYSKDFNDVLEVSAFATTLTELDNPVLNKYTRRIVTFVCFFGVRGQDFCS